MLGCALALSMLASFSIAAPSAGNGEIQKRQSGSNLVFAHFMLGVVGDRKSASDYDNDMKQAKDAGIDAFALNIGIDTFTKDQLTWAYQSAHDNGMSVFISFDFNWYQTSQASDVGAMVKAYGSLPAQLKVDNKVFVSSFQGDGLNLDAVRSAAGMNLFIVPYFEPKNLGSADGLFNWMAWPNNGNNKAPDGTKLTINAGDKTYQSALGSKPYMAPVSPWFSTHFGLEVSYSKNWVFPADSLWFDRWTEILTLGSQFVEIITWNDYGESHYVGPLSSPHADDGNSKWVNDMPHDGWLAMAKPFIAAFKAGSKTVNDHITTDQLIYWYRPTLKSASCDSTDTCQQPWPASNPPNRNYFTGKPHGYETMQDSIFLVAMLKEAGTVTAKSGSSTMTWNAEAGANSFSVPMGTGKQSFSLTRNGQNVLSGDSLKEITSDCVCGIYNFNAYVGTLPAGPSNFLQADGLKNFTYSLPDKTCQATPSLGTASGAVLTAASINTAPSGGSVAGGSVPAATSAVVAPQTSAPAGGSAQQPVANSPNSSTATPVLATSAAPAPTSSAASVASGNVMTALGQFGPKNCLPKGDTWAGPAGSDAPAPCDV